MRLFVGLSIALVLSSSSLGRAQGGSSVVELNRQAMDAYTALELDRARSLLQQALQRAQAEGLTGTVLARTYLNLGIVYIGGFQDNAQGLANFIQAIQTDPAIELDPLTSSPEIQTVFKLAKRRAEVSDTGLPGPRVSGGIAPGGQPAGTASLTHAPVPEQLAQTPVPVFLELPQHLDVQTVYLYYRGIGMRDYLRAQMEPMAGGFGYEIPCNDVFEPRVEYYIVAFAGDGSPLGFAGTAQQPIVVPIVASRTQPPPALPGRAPPQQCVDAECPPGVDCGSGEQFAGGPGDACVTTAECAEGLICDRGGCVFGEEAEEEFIDEDVPAFFLRVGGTLGAGYVTPGLPADPRKPPSTGDVSPWVPNTDSQCGREDGQSCVAVANAGFVPTFALRVTAGYYVSPRVALAATVRFQPRSGGDTPVSNLLLGGRLQYLFTQPAAEGLNIAGFVGTSYGQIQVQPQQEAGAEGPFVVAGLNGIQAGGVLGYRFIRNVGVHVTPEAHFLFPNTLFVLDLTAGIELAF